MYKSKLEWMREPVESFKIRPTHCINKTCGIRLNMPGTIGTCSAVCRNAVDATLIHISRRANL